MTPLTADERAAWVRAVCAAPDDDGPRLIFADRLDEAGNADDADQAAFIRAGIALESFRAPNSGVIVCEGAGPPFECSHFGRYRKRCRCEPCTLRRREYNAGKRHVVWDWCGGVDGGWAPLVRSSDYRRGFVERVTLNWPAACAHLDAVLEAAPVTEVTLNGDMAPVVPATESLILTGGGIELLLTLAQRARRAVEMTPCPRCRGMVRTGRISPIIHDTRHSVVVPASCPYCGWRPDALTWLKALWPRVTTWHLPPAPHDGPSPLRWAWPAWTIDEIARRERARLLGGTWAG